MDNGNYGDVYNSLATQYQPQTDLVNSQIADLPRQQQAVQSSLDQAKVNAFKDITNSANAKGVLFSGVPIDQQSTYVGTKYLPAVANNQTAFQNTKNTLLGQINTLQAGRQKQAQDSVSAYQKAQQDNAYKQAQLDLGYARLNSSNSNSAADRAARSKTESQGQIMQQDMAGAAQFLFRRQGTDQHVNPADWRDAYNRWTSAGYKGSDFLQQFHNYINPNGKNHYVGFN